MNAKEFGNSRSATFRCPLNEQRYGKGNISYQRRGRFWEVLERLVQVLPQAIRENREDLENSSSSFWPEDDCLRSVSLGLMTRDDLGTERYRFPIYSKRLCFYGTHCTCL